MNRTRTLAGLAMAPALVGCASLSDWIDASALGAFDEPAPATRRVATPPPVEPRSAPDHGIGTSIGVVTVNLKGGGDMQRLRAIGRDLDSEAGPDFILCQEVLFERPGAYDSTAAIIAAQLGYFARGSRRRSDRQGVAIISRFPFEHYEHRHLSAHTARVLLGFRRVSAMGEFRVPRIGRVRVVNVHLAHWPFEEHVRERQLRETLQWVARRQRAVPADLTILGGDFNADPGSPTLEMLERPGVAGSLTYADHNSRRPTKGTMVGRRVDHIFVASSGPRVTLTGEDLLWSNGLSSLDGRTTFRPSDHLAVMHRYSIREDEGDG